jgi:dipeptidyl aminopeptidase/acylaminoacyl peptidase
VAQTTLQSTDLFRMRWVLDPALSPDGRQVAYILKQVHPDDLEERYRYELVLLDVDAAPKDGVGRRLLPGFESSVRHPRWSPDGAALAFLSNASGAMQIWLLDLVSGGLRRLTDADPGVVEFDWSPDSATLAVIADVTDTSGQYGEFKPGRFRVLRRLGYKTDGSGYWNGSWPELFVVEPTASEPTAGSQLTSEKHGVTGARWSPDGTAIAYIAAGDADPDRTSVRNIYVADVSGKGAEAQIAGTRQLTSGLAISSLSWSPSGTEIAFLGDDLSDDRATNTGVWVVRCADKALINLAADIDRPAGDYVTDDMNAEAGAPAPIWSRDGRALLVIMSDCGRSITTRFVYPGDEAFAKGVARSYADQMAPDPWQGTIFSASPVCYDDHRVFALDYDGAATAVEARSSTESPGDIYLLTLRDGEPTAELRMTNVNRDLLANRSLAKPEPFAFTGSEGRRIEGWLLLPSNDAALPYPLVLHIHGGPHSAYSMAFNFELQHLAAQGYAVLFVNPHGSHTYGRQINIGTRLDWGGKDYHDLMLAVDHAIERPEIDRSRLGVAGGSYGGWMTNYIVTRTNRFKAAVAQRSSSNRISTMLSSTVGYKHQRWEAPGYPWEDLDYFIRISPVLHADKVETPLLLEHAEEDHLCPLMQAEEMFTALMALGKPVELLYFLGESHHMLRGGKPGNRVERLDRVAAWLNAYV